MFSCLSETYILPSSHGCCHLLVTFRHTSGNGCRRILMRVRYKFKWYIRMEMHSTSERMHFFRICNWLPFKVNFSGLKACKRKNVWVWCNHVLLSLLVDVDMWSAMQKCNQDGNRNICPFAPCLQEKLNNLLRIKAI